MGLEERVAASMREAYGKFCGDDIVPWDKAALCGRGAAPAGSAKPATRKIKRIIAKGKASQRA